MKKIFSIIIVIIILNYIKNENCESITPKSENDCKNGETEIQKCSYIAATTGNNEEQNAKCELVAKNCKEITAYSTETCEQAVSDSNKGCIYNGDICEDKDLCTLVQSPTSDDDCKKAPRSNNIVYKCIFIKDGNRCEEQVKSCSEIIFGANDEICKVAPVSDSNSKECISINGKCEEKDKKSSEKSSVKSSEKSSVKSSEKSSVKSSEKSSVKSSEKSSVKSSEKSSVKSSENSSMKSSGKPSVKSSGKPSVESSDKSNEEKNYKLNYLFLIIILLYLI